MIEVRLTWSIFKLSLIECLIKYVMHYQDHLSKYNISRPVKSKRTTELAYHLLQIFIDFGASAILQSDNSREFVITVKILKKMNY